MTYDTAIRVLRAALAGPLPGVAAQDRLAPLPRREWPPGADPSQARQAAGLLLVYPIDDRAHVVLTVRSAAVRHAGQVSLPGGVVDPGESLAAAALREAQEEIAVEPASVSLLGALTPLDIPVSGFRLHPIVGAAAPRPALRRADAEVARILEIALDELLAPASLSAREMIRDGRALLVPAFRLHDAEIWGATAMVLAEFLALFGWDLDRMR